MPIDRRTFTAVLAGTLAVPRTSSAQSAQAKSEAAFYASVGPAITLYAIDINAASLERRGTVTLPANVQYAWRHPALLVLYAVSSNGGPGIPGDQHQASALRIDPASGTLSPHGPAAALRSRPIHTCVDGTGAYLLVAHNNPSAVTVLRIDVDGTIGDEVTQAAAPDAGIFAHQIRVMPSNAGAILVHRSRIGESNQAASDSWSRWMP